MNMAGKIALLYGVMVNIVGFVLMGMDKRRARKHQWRIPEKTLFLTAFLLGSIGTWGGMYVFHHKTRHWYFVVGMPLILAAQMILGIVLWYSLAK